MRILVALYGRGGYADNEACDKSDYAFPHEHPTLGRFYGDLQSHQILEKVEWDVHNFFYQMIKYVYRVREFSKRHSLIYNIWA